MNSRFIFFTIALMTPVFATGGESPRALSAEEALRLAAEHNTQLRAALLAEDRAEAAVTAEEGLYPLVFGADSGLTHTSSPSVTQTGAVVHQRRDEAAVGASLSKTLPFGTATSLRVEGSRQVSQGPAVGGIAATTRDPAYGLTTTLSVTQPLLRGFGNRVGRSGLRQAEGEKALAKDSTKRAASELARSVLRTYWELWYAALAVEIDSRARDIAKSQLDETRQRVDSGDAAPVDLLAFQTRIATLEEMVLTAEAARRQSAIELSRLIGIIGETPEVYPGTGEPLPVSSGAPTLDSVTRKAMDESPAIREAETAVALAEERTRTAGEEMRQRLDLTGWAEARTLGNDQVSPLFTQYGDQAAYSAYIGLLYELPLDDRRREAERAQARIGVAIAQEQLATTRQQVQADAAKALDALVSAQQRLVLAEATFEVARQQAEAERERYTLGAAIFTTVRDAEESVREAELRKTRARVDLVQAETDLDHLTGTLLKRLPRLSAR